MNVDFLDARAAKRAYMKQWRANNPDKVKAAQMRYWNKKAHEQRSEQEDKKPSKGEAENEKR